MTDNNQSTHRHGHQHGHNHSHGSSENLITAFVLNAVFVIIEVIGGLLTNSIAILTDALHDFGDCLSLGVAWAMDKRSKRGRDSRYSYGYKRFSLMGSIFLSGVLTVSSLIVVYEAVQRIITPQPVVASGMLWVAIVGVVINGAAALKVVRGSSLNERTVYLHIMEDVLGWIAVLLDSIVMMFADVPIIDPILSLAISVWVLVNVYRNLKATFTIMLQAVPADIDIDTLKTSITAVAGVASLHDLHIWSLDGESHVMTLHVVTDEADTAVIKARIIDIATAQHIDHTTIEFETSATNCTTSCD